MWEQQPNTGMTVTRQAPGRKPKTPGRNPANLSPGEAWASVLSPSGSGIRHASENPSSVPAAAAPCLAWFLKNLLLVSKFCYRLEVVSKTRPREATIMDDRDQAKARSAEIMARVTGAVEVTYTVERVDWSSGERRVISTTSAVYRRQDKKS